MYSHHFSLLSLTSLLSAPEREVTSPSDIKCLNEKKQSLTILCRAKSKGEDSMKTYKIMLFGIGIASYPFFFLISVVICVNEHRKFFINDNTPLEYTLLNRRSLKRFYDIYPI
jgi:hypothetical protein